MSADKPFTKDTTIHHVTRISEKDGCYIWGGKRMRKLFILTLGIWLAAFLGGCGKTANTPKETEALSTYLDISYGEDSNQIMDIVLPRADKAKEGVILLIHGGAWVEGDKRNHYTDELMERYGQSGYIVATMNYRFASENITVEDMLEDIEAALNFIKKIAAGNGINATKCMLTGWSSGGHLAELYAYTMAREADIEVTCVVAYSGIADLTDHGLYIENPLDEILNRPMTEVVSNLCGCQFNSSDISVAEPYMRKASPIAYAETAVPTVICHSAVDTYVSYDTAVHLKEQLEYYGIENCFIDFPNSGHDLLKDPDSLKLSYEKLEEYAQKYLK